jgi:HCOMODA/2-hydroxy-3-carboxy-muconic semialdehyde decarboxylase
MRQERMANLATDTQSLKDPAAGADPALIQELVAANHMLYRQRVVDGFGHVSVRHNTKSDCFLLARSMAPALVAATDIVAYDLDGEPIEPDGRTAYLERFIHGEIYRVRPDVVAVVHSHSPSVIPFGIASGVTLRPVFHMSAFLGAGAPVFEIRNAVGPASDMLIRSRELGQALAYALGPHTAVLMRGHGSTVVGSNLRQVVFRAIYTELNARLQSEAMRLGPVTFLNAEEAANATATNNGQINRAWELWKRETDIGF